jgi:2-polyprenyl-3-methyl-5-hydroxy-6-metoxy-1,4-benzoquinol methylase
MGMMIMEKRQVSRQDELLDLNKQQAIFYNTPAPERKLNFIMKCWRTLRRRMYFLMEKSGIWEDIYSLHKQWIGPLEGKKVLDFGCFDGNTLSDYLAANAGSYLGVDLSHEALLRLQAHFEEANIASARVQCVDVLSPEFTETGFDVIYAQGVLHHFKPIDLILQLLQKKLAPGGRIVTLDPLQTSFLTRSVRAIYHPFRVDREWEWPFTRETFAIIERYFYIAQLQGVVGYSKWAIPFAFINRNIAIRIGKLLHDKDLHLATTQKIYLWNCMHVAMVLEHTHEND